MKLLEGVTGLARDVLAGFERSPREIPSKYLYDDKGAALYDQIVNLPEYYPPRIETVLLETYASEIVQRTGPVEMVELGAGSATRTRLLLNAVVHQGWALRFMPTDGSAAMLGSSVDHLRRDYPHGVIEGLVGEFGSVLGQLEPRSDRLILFLGGTFGNLDDAEIADLGQRVRAALLPGSWFLLGFDRRPHAGKLANAIEAAYNDSAGVTAAFNLNVLARLNRELGADFNLSAFAHYAPYEADFHRIAMYASSLRDQMVHIRALDKTYHFAIGDCIRTEVSRKFDGPELAEMMGLQSVEMYGDKIGLFGLHLMRRP